MDEEVALKTLKEMISNFIAQDSLFPQGLDMKKQEKMIGAVFGEKLSSSGGKDKVIHETRTVLNGLVNVKIEELSNKDYDEGKKCSKNPNTIKKLAGLYKLADAKVDYQKIENDEGKLV
ncbi:1176_t:CDS:1 [Paraglomus brasilianum]|uniref:1176_t:CDS:1 n=1 Tax=Paraglomus brasilianum TaxID=144538 RepID=A0A9N9AYQ5_9GLOM|nr:1176_t:CDS:1 [Paraglomus brasilianum]